MALNRFIAWSLFALLAADAAYAAGSIYSVHLAYESGRLTLIEMHVIEGFADAGTEDGQFECRLISADGKTVNYLRFNIPNKIYYDEIDPATGALSGGYTTLDKTEFRLFVPHDPSAEKMEFYDENNTLFLSADLCKYSGSNTGKNSAGSDLSSSVPYLLSALFLVAACFIGLRKRKDRRIAEKRAEFERWKS